MASSSSSSPEISAANGADHQKRFSYKHATHEEVLEDLSSRFILNLPDEELASLERICFQVEQAHWFYEDFIREENPKFPSLPLKRFSAMLFHACPLLHQWSHDHEQAFNTFMQYKTRVPVCGAIMLNDTWEKCVLVKGWKSSSGWGFPKGKINEDEPPVHCAIREVLEETGYNLASQIDPQNVIEMSIKEQKISLFIVPGVPEDYPFKTKTRKEISKIEWFKLIDLPTWRRNKTAAGKFYLISPFIGALKAFVNERKPRATPRKAPRAKKLAPSQTSYSREQFPGDVDVTNESSSQSSSAENGGPQTPSPQYSKSLANAIPQAERNDTNLAISDAALDPHFVRLLSSLSMSASKSKGPLSEDIQKPPNNSLFVDIDQHEQKESTTPVPISASFTGSHRPVLVDWSASAPKPLPPHSPHLRAATFTPLSTQVTPASHRSPLSLSRNSQPLLTNGFSGISVHPHPPTSSLPTIVPNSPTNTVVSHRSATGHTSSFADISPYLSPPTEVPASTKTLRQIALLETVADESARMTSLAHRKFPPDLRRPHNFMHFMPPGSVPPPLVPHNSSAPKSPFLPELSYDPYYIRPRTSHAFHHSPLNLQGSADINKSHLLGLMSSPRAAPQTPHFHPHVQHVPSISTHAGSVQSSSYPFAATTPEVLGHHPSKNTPHHNPNSLLSILNNTRRRSGGLNF